MPRILRFSTDSGETESSGLEDNGRLDVARDEAAQRDAAQADEANMRRALGMLGGTARQSQPGPGPSRERRPANPVSSTPRRHRFVQDGDVPVTVMRTRPDHASEILAPSNGSAVNRLEALQVSLTSEHAARERAERALDEAQGVIRDLRTKLAHMELAREEALMERDVVEVVTLVEVAVVEPIEPTSRVTVRAAKKPSVPRAPRPEKEQQPVKWWIKTRAKKT